MCNTHGRIWHLVSLWSICVYLWSFCWPFCVALCLCGRYVAFTCHQFVSFVVVLYFFVVINLIFVVVLCLFIILRLTGGPFLSLCSRFVSHTDHFVVVWLIDPTGNVASHLIMRFCPAAPSLVPGATTPSGSAPVCPSSPLFRSSSRGVLSHTVEEEKTHKKRECTDPLRSHKFNIFILPRLPKSAWECIQWVHKSQHCQRGDGDARGRRHSVHSRAGTLRQIRATLIPSVGLMRF